LVLAKDGTRILEAIAGKELGKRQRNPIAKGKTKNDPVGDGVPPTACQTLVNAKIPE